MSEFEKKRKEALERSRLAKEKGNNFSKLMAFKKRLAGGGGAAAASHAEVVAALPDAKRPKIGKVRCLLDPCLCTAAFKTGRMTPCSRGGCPSVVWG